MQDGSDFYPRVDTDFFLDLIKKHYCIEDRHDNTHLVTIAICGTKSLAKRTINVGITACGTLDLGYCMGQIICHGIHAMEDLLEWLKENRNWKDGGYFDPNHNLN